MFKRRRAKDAAATRTSPPTATQQQQLRNGSASTASNTRPPPSPLPVDFDFQLPSPAFGADIRRPQTSDGIAPRSSGLGSAPPILPPIPRVSSHRESQMMDLGQLSLGIDSGKGKGHSYERVDMEGGASRSSAAKSGSLFDPGIDVSSFPQASSSATPKFQDTRPATSGDGGVYKMEPSLFPTKAPLPTLPPIDTDMPMSRAWIDARDKPYGPPPAKPQLQSTNSSPDLRSAVRASSTATPTRSPRSAMSGNATPRPVPQQSFSTGNMNALVRPPSNAPTNYSGTTARSTRSSKSTAVASDAPIKTIGTPYQETSPSFPLPQHVATRPKTSGTMATVRGVDVPTHHTSAIKPRPEGSGKTEKRKTKLLNPMHLLARRRSGQDDEALATERAAQAQALQRQKNVAAVGVNRLPEDFDPRIRGKVVHDFSAPRQSRVLSYNDAIGPWSQANGRERGLQSSNSAPYIPSLQEEEGSQRVRVFDGSPRRSSHTPIFKEHLAEAGVQSDSAAAVQAERLENKAFLNRASHISQESAILPPFARRSQQVEVMPGAYYHDDGLSERSMAGQKEPEPRMSSSSSNVSPITQRNSVLPGAMDAQRQSMSPVSPATPDKPGGRPFSRPISRPVSEVSRVESSDGGKPQRMSEVSRLGSSDGVGRASTISSTSEITGRSPSDATTRHVSVPPAVEPIAEEQTPKLGDGFVLLPERPAPAAPVTPQNERASLNGSPGISSLQPTPESDATEASAVPKSPPKLVQRRADAVGHAKRVSSGATPKKHVSNASRFSFQFGGSAAEEQALEEKARRLTLVGGSESAPDGGFDDDDYFDEDAMDDMDEMEVQAQQQDDEEISGGIGTMGLSFGPNSEAQYMPTFMPMADARQKLQLDDDSDGGSEIDSSNETPYWKHDAFGSHAHTRNASEDDGKATTTLHRRKTSDDAKLTLNTNVGPNGSGFVQDGFAAAGNARSGFYMQPQAAGYSPTLTHRVTLPQQKPPLPHRASGNSEQNRIASGLQFGPKTDGLESMHKAALSKSTIGSLDEVADGSFSESGLQGSYSTEATGLGLSGFSGFKFIDSPGASRPLSLESEPRHRPSGADRSRGDSETLPQAATFGNTGVANFPSGRDLGSTQDHYEDDQYDLDDMYFDDGGFEPDMNDRNHLGEAVDENAFDDDAFLRKPNGIGHAVQPVHQNGNTSFNFYGLGSDGPYPSFAMPRSTRAWERDSQMLLEDLPLYEEPFDPRWIPRRNPSEDAKRLGRSNKVPPLPLQGSSPDAVARVQAHLQTYHAALAEAATKAAADGKFQRLPSISTTRSGSAYPTGEDEAPEPHRRDDQSQYSMNEDDEPGSTLNGNSVLNHTDSKTVPDSTVEQGSFYSPSKMGFDFGFDSAPMDDSLLDSDFDTLGDDDIVAAANAEALANDDDGFYGQEFGFYAKARPNSGDLEAINGGFFGLDGDDGLARQKSLKEPNLTPITERSEFSTRNSFVSLGMGGQHGPPSAGPFSPFPGSARLPVSPWVENEVTTFDQLRKLKASAFGGSNLSLHSDSSGGLQMNSGSAPVSARSSAAAQGYFGPLGGAPMTFGYSTDSSGSSNPSSAHPHHGLQVQDSPHSAASGSHLPFSMDPDATPKRHSTAVDTPMTARKVSDKPNRGHSRTSSGADSVTYVREQDPDGNGPPRWVLEKRRTSEQGQLELVAREIVQDGWI